MAEIIHELLSEITLRDSCGYLKLFSCSRKLAKNSFYTEIIVSKRLMWLSYLPRNAPKLSSVSRYFVNSPTA